MGLFLGISLMSFVEIIELMVVLVYTFFKKENNQVTNNSEDPESDITTAETDIQTNTTETEITVKTVIHWLFKKQNFKISYFKNIN